MFDPQKYIRGCYKLPGNIATDEYVIPCSGGADSTVMAILMCLLFPHIKFRLVFTDTLADELEIYETLDNLEKFLGRKIERIIPKLGLYQLIEEKYNGFLPSSQDRFCTRELKIVPIEQFIGWIKPLAIMGGQVWSFVGLRWDEPGRSGLVSQDDQVNTELPFKAWKIVRDDVFAILDETVGIPRYYQSRTRSGCYTCWGMRRMEVVGLFERHPVEFRRAGALEKLSSKDKAKSREYVPVYEELGIGANWVAFPIPAELDTRNPEAQRHAYPGWRFFDMRSTVPPPTVKTGNVLQFPSRHWMGEKKTNWKSLPGSDEPEGEQSSLLSMLDPINRLWVGVEFRIDPGIGGDGVFWQQIVTFSSSRGGLSRQLQGHYEHRLRTAEAIGLSQEEVRSHVKYAVYCIEAPKAMMDVERPSEGSYTWKSGESYDMTSRLTQFAKRTLNAERIAQDARIAEAEGKPKRAEKLRQERSQLKGPMGTVIGMTSFTPKEPVKLTEDEEDERFVPCFACSI